MRTVILGAAIMLAAATPASAQSWPGAAIGSGSAFAGTPAYSSGGATVLSGGGEWRHRGDGRRHRGQLGVPVYGGYERDYQGDTAWRANSFNDWWHERPNRAFPRWMQNNQNCERQWWGGGQWRC